jgi:hypothetical protein
MGFTHEENLLYLKEEREMLNSLKENCSKLGGITKFDDDVICVCESMVNIIDNHINEAIYSYDTSYELRSCLTLAGKFMLAPLLKKQRDELIRLIFNN